MDVYHSNGMVQAFCWLCGASTGRSHTWETISGHSCGRYKEDADKKINEAQRYSPYGCCHSLRDMHLYTIQIFLEPPHRPYLYTDFRHSAITYAGILSHTDRGASRKYRCDQSSACSTVLLSCGTQELAEIHALQWAVGSPCGQPKARGKAGG